MCGRRQNRSCGGSFIPVHNDAATVPTVPNPQQTGVVSLVEAINHMALQPETPKHRDFPQHDLPHNSGKTILPPTVTERNSAAVPPPYEQAVGENPCQPQEKAIKSVHDVDHHQMVNPVPQPALIPQGIEMFKQALAAYQNSPRQNKCAKKRAAKHLVRDLYAAEISRREVEHGRLRCGERKQIWHELKPLKHTFRSMVL